MASEAEIHRVRKDPQAWRLIVTQLLRYDEALESKDLGFLDSLASRTAWLEELSYRQAEWLLDIRDAVQTVSEYHGYSVKTLIRLCFENRFDLLLEDETEEWIVQIRESGRTTLRKYEAGRLHTIAKRLDVADNWAA